MTFSVPSSDLQKVLSNISGVIPTRSPLPILENFLFELSGGNLIITATDLEISMQVSLKIQGSREGKIAVPAKRLFETIRALPETTIEFKVDLASNKITMQTTNGEYKLTGESAENYPSMPIFKGKDEINVTSETLRRLISKTIFAVSSDELRPAMMGVLFQIKKSEIKAAATDGHRLVRLSNSAITSGQVERDVIVPAKALNLVLKSISDTDTNVAFNETHAMFSLGDTILMSRMIDEKYPNYESVIPLDNEKKLVVNNAQLLSSVKRISLYASLTTHQVRLSLRKGSLAISAEDIDFGSEAKETLECEYSAEPMEIGFNSSYLIEVLSHIDTDQVMFLLSTPTRAGIVKPMTQREGENLLMLVMPVRLNV